MPADPHTDDDDTALFAELEKEDLAGYRQHRIEQLGAEFASAAGRGLAAGTDAAAAAAAATAAASQSYPTLASDKAVLDLTTAAQRSVVHFAHPDFARCDVMDETLRRLASLHHETRFARVDVRSTPFVVQKLNVRVLPYVIAFKDGAVVERIVGFEGLGRGSSSAARRTTTQQQQQQQPDDGVDAARLERRLFFKGALVKTRLADMDGGRYSDSADDSDVDDTHVAKRPSAIRTGGIARTDDDDDDWD